MNYQAKGIYDAAHNFLVASNTLNEKLSETNDLSTYLAPYITVSSFSIELFLKCLYALEKGKKAKNIHKLYQLYDALSDDSKIIIKMLYEMYAEKDPSLIVLKSKVPEMKTDLEDILKDMSNAFVNWRYSYEGNLTSFQGSGPIINAIIGRISMLQPDWFEKKEDLLPEGTLI